MAHVRHDWRTTIFSANIVGAGTGAHIEDSLKGSRYEDLVSEVGASEVTHEISFRHAPHIDINGVCVILHKSAYEIYGARTINARGQVVSTLNFLYAADRNERPRQRNWRNSFVSQVNGAPSPAGSRDSSRSRSRSRSRTRVRRLTGSHDVPIPTYSPSFAKFTSGANDVAFYDKTNRRSYIRDENAPVIRPSTQRTYTGESSYSQPSFDQQSNFDSKSFNERDVEKGFEFDIQPLRTVRTHETRPDPVLATTLSPRLIPRKPTSNATPIRSALKPAASINRTYDATLSVGGMTCAACTNAVKDGLSELDYVESVTVDLMTNSAQVRYNGTAADAMKLAEAVEDLGFEGSVIKTAPFGSAPVKKAAPKKATFATAPQEYETTLSVGGMTCAACTNAVKDAFMELDWVRSANVDLMTNSASVKYYGTAQDAKKLADAVEEVGFEGSVIKVTPCAPLPKATGAKTASNGPAILIASLSVGGMTCAACTNAVKDALSEIEWVNSATVDLMTNSARVEYQGTRQDAQKLVDAVEEVGFEGSIMAVTATANVVEDKPQSNMYRATLSVGGMTCAACSSSVTEGIESLDFVEDCNVSLMTNSASVLFEGKQNLEKLIERVEDLGFECALKECIPVKAADDEDDVSESGPRTIDLKIEGLNSEAAINEILSSIDDYASWAVVQNPPTLKHPVISIEYEPLLPDQTSRSLATLISEIDSSFHVSFYHPPSIEECSKQMQQHEKNRILRRLALALIAAIPTFIIGIVFMDLLSDMNPIRVYFMAPMWTGQVTCADWSLFFTATPVMFFSADLFHTRALKEIRAIWRPGSKVPLARRFYRFGSMNLLISAGTSVAYFSSLAILIVGAVSKQPGVLNNTYFDSVVFLTFFILIGKFLEAYSKSKTGDAVSMLAKLRPEKATLIVERESSTSKEDVFEKEKEIMVDVKETGVTGTSIVTVDADFLEVGDRVLVPHGSSPPADGVLVTVEAKFDESSLTGESRAVTKVTGDSVFIGTINLGDPATIEITKLGGSSMLDQIVAVVREGQTKRAPIERVADILTGYFVPVITALAILTFTIWLILGYSGALDQKYLNGQQGGWAFWSLEFAIAVFVVACPCGIGLAAPTALFVGGGLAAKHGILVRGGGESFQEAGDLDAIVFDKTGTLTEGGDLKVTDFSMLVTNNRAVYWAIIRCLEEQSTHPLAKAIYETAQTQQQEDIIVDNITEVAGYGLKGTFILPKTSSRPREIVLEAALGNERLMTTLEPSPPPRNHYAEQLLSTWKNQGKSIAVLSVREINESRSTQDPWSITTIFATADPIRPSAFPAVKALQARGLQVYMLSGDNPETARAVAAELSIPATNVFAGVLPAQKQEKILYLQSHAPLRQRTSFLSRVTSLFRSKRMNTSHRAKIAFVGDGINDAPALLAADVSISPSTGSPIALTSSSFVLLSPSLMTIPRLLNLSTRIFTRIRLNFAWALCYNIMLVPVAAGVFFRTRPDGFQLGPIWAAAAMAMSSLSVVCSSLALRYEGGWRFWRKKTLEEL